MKIALITVQEPRYLIYIKAIAKKRFIDYCTREEVRIIEAKPRMKIS